MSDEQKTTDTEVEGEVVSETSLALVPAGTGALASQSDAQFEKTLAAIRQGQVRLAKMQKELLIDGVDYGNVPGVDKPSLGKPGAEKLGLAYHLAARVERVMTYSDGVSAPAIQCDATTHLHL